MRFLLFASLAGTYALAAAQALNASTVLQVLESTTTCAGCESLLLILKSLALLGDDAFVDTITGVCVLSKLEDKDVCEGAVGMEGPIIAQSLREMIIPSHTAQAFCTSLVGLCSYPPVREYDLTFPQPKPDLSRPASSGEESIQVVHFSDIHVDLEYAVGSNYNCSKPICCRPYEPSDAAGNTSFPCGPNGNHNCDTPKSLSESMYDAIAQFAPDASFALFTGDIPEHTIWLVNQSGVTNDMHDAYDTMSADLNIPVFAVAGNHEAAPVNSFPPAAIRDADSSQWVYDAISSDWAQWIGTDAAAQADTFGGYSYKLPDSNLRVISVNTNFYYKLNFWLYETVMEYDPSGQLAWLVTELQAAETNGERVYILGHMPFGCNDALHDGSHYLDQIVNRYEATIAAMFFGHTHLDHFELTYSDYTSRSALTAKMTSYIAPSLTPTSGSPSFRVYTVDPVTFGILDFTQYTASLEAPDYQTSGPVWSEYYTAKAAYSTSPDITADPTAELTPAFWHNATVAMEQSAEAFQAYYARKSRGWNVKPCSGTCAASEICGLRAADAQFNCVVPTPGFNFGKKVRRDNEEVGEASGETESECHGSITSSVLRRVAGSQGEYSAARR